MLMCLQKYKNRNKNNEMSVNTEDLTQPAGCYIAMREN